MSKDPKVSVIVTTYNVEGYIERCLSTILSQDYTNLEILLIDDGSTDNTFTLAKNLSNKSERDFSVTSFKNNTIGGVGTAANEGIRRSAGEYIVFADGDDWYKTDWISKMVSLLVTSDADLGLVNYLEYDEHRQEYKRPADWKRWKKIDIDQRFISNDEKKMVLPFIAVPWRKIYKASLLKENKIFFPEGDFFFEDNPFHWFAVIKANKIVFLNEILCFHRVNRPGQTMVSKGSELLAFFVHFETINKWLESNSCSTDYFSELVFWIFNQHSWISGKISLEFYFDLYECMQRILEKFGLRETLKLIDEKQLSQNNLFIALSIFDKQFTEYVKIIKYGVSNGSSLEKYSGLLKSIDERLRKVQGLMEANLLFEDFDKKND